MRTHSGTHSGTCTHLVDRFSEPDPTDCARCRNLLTNRAAREEARKRPSTILRGFDARQHSKGY